MKKKLIAISMLVVLMMSGCSKQETRVKTLYNIDVDSYTEMMEVLIRYSSLTGRMQDVIKQTYSDYITPSALDKLSQFRNMKYYEENDSVIVVEWYDNEGDSIEYPIFNSYGTIDSYGTYDEYLESYESFINSPLNTLTSVERYGNMLLFNYNNKFNGRMIVRVKLNVEGKIDDIAVLR